MPAPRMIMAAAAVVAAAVARAPAQEGDVEARQPAAEARAIPEHEFFKLPPDAVLSWAMNPAPLGARPDPPAGASISASLMRLVVARGMLPEGPAGEAAAATLIASALSSAPHRIILLDVEGDSGEDGDGLRITALALIVEIWTTADHTPLRNTVRAALVDHDKQAGAGAQRSIDLGAGRAAMAYTRPDWPAWREVAWYSEEGRFIVAIGEGALARWLDQRERQYLHDPWSSHRRPATDWLQQSSPRAARAPRVVELAADLDRLRRGFPDAISEGLAGQFFRAWGLSNARSFMLHGRLVPPAAPGEQLDPDEPEPADDPAPRPPSMLALSATWSSRAEPPNTAHHKPVAPPAWPVTLGPAPTSRAPWACALAVNWPAAISRSFGTWGAAMPLDERRRRGPGIDRWLRANGPRLSGVLALLDPAAAVTAPAPPVPSWPPAAGGLVIAPARDGVEAEALESQIRALMRALPPVRFAPDTRTWAVSLLPEPLDPTGALGQLAWGVAERAGRTVLLAAAGADARQQVDQARRKTESP
jgi:hypothetical protein